MANLPFKLGYLIPEFPTQTHIFFYREAVAIQASGIELQWLSTSMAKEFCPHPFAKELIPKTFYAYPPKFVDVLTLLASISKWPKLTQYVFKAMSGERFRRKIQLLGMVLCAARLVRGCKKMAITHIHAHSCADAAHLVALAWLMGGSTYSLALHGSLENYGIHHGLKMADAVCITSDGNHLVEEIATQVGYPRAGLKSVPMGLDTGKFTPRGEEGERTGADVIEVVMVARLSEGKGHKYAIEAIRRLKEEGWRVRLTAAGSGPLAEVLKEQIQELGLGEGDVKLAGSLPEAEVFRLVRSADIFMLPTYGSFEAYPVAVMEAMSCGVAVVVSRTGATPEMIESGVDGILVEKHDVEGLTGAIRSLVDDPGLRQRMGRAARERAVRQFEVARTSAALVGFIRARLGERGVGVGS